MNKENEKALSVCSKDERAHALNIFKTDADIYGTNIAEMSNFFDGYIQEMSVAIRKSDDLQNVLDMPIAYLGILGDVINQAGVIMQGNVMLLPDFDNLPSDIKTNLKKGIYTVGESKQVDGNLRAVILDENGVRIKDITLKKVPNNPGNIEAVRSISNQMQMRQIYAKLSDIEDFQTYQIERDRDRDIIVPFLDARELIIESAKKGPNKRVRILREADGKLRSALNSVYRDMETTAKTLVKKVDRPFGLFNKQANTYMSYMADNLQIATKYVGVRMQLLEYLGDQEAARRVLELYNHTLLDFINKPITKRGLSVADVMQDYFPYNENNMDGWLEFSNELAPVLKSNLKQLETQQCDFREAYVVSVEDVKNERDKKM